MTIRLVCDGGKEVKFVKAFADKLSLFRRWPELIHSHSYKLVCQASAATVELLLERVYDESSHVTITEDNFDSLRNLSLELGFSGLDEALHAFETSKRDSPMNHSHRMENLEELINDVYRQNQAIMRLLSIYQESVAHCPSLEQFRVLEQRVQRLEEKLTQRNDIQGSIEARVKALETTVNEITRVSAERVAESKMIDQAIAECAKRDVEDLARDIAELHESEDVSGRTAPMEFVCDGSGLFEGVIAHLTRQCGGNIHQRGIVNVTANNVARGLPPWDCAPQNVVDLGTNSCYHSNDRVDTCITFDFKVHRVIPKSYSLKSNGWGPECDHLRSWVLEVSKDGASFVTADQRDNNKDLNGSFAKGHFKIQFVPRDAVRFIRLRQTQPNHHGYGYVNFAALEIFGSLF